MLDGLQRLSGEPVPRRKRIGVRPAHMCAAIAPKYGVEARSRNASNWAALCLRLRLSLLRERV